MLRSLPGQEVPWRPPPGDPPVPLAPRVWCGAVLRPPTLKEETEFPSPAFQGLLGLFPSFTFGFSVEGEAIRDGRDFELPRETGKAVLQRGRGNRLPPLRIAARGGPQSPPPSGLCKGRHPGRTLGAERTRGPLSPAAWVPGSLPACSPLLPTGVPQVEVFTLYPLQLGRPNTLVCSVTNTFPPSANITWEHHNQTVVQGVSTTQISPVQGLEFQIFSYLEVTPQQGDVYSCIVRAPRDDFSYVGFWVPKDPIHSELLENIICGIAFGVGVLSAITGLILILRARRRR
uniref:Major histocompatibility complex, class II, DM alpha n=1 Tax=Salvator merianae TaxID=96440 RepID=A0A8D0BDL9_SALMN